MEEVKNLVQPGRPVLFAWLDTSVEILFPKIGTGHRAFKSNFHTMMRCIRKFDHHGQRVLSLADVLVTRINNFHASPETKLRFIFHPGWKFVVV